MEVIKLLTATDKSNKGSHVYQSEKSYEEADGEMLSDGEKCSRFLIKDMGKERRYKPEAGIAGNQVLFCGIQETLS